MTAPFLTKRRIIELLEQHDLAPSRALGQNFLCDPGTVDKIVRLAGVGPGDRVLEIGAGLGSLTVGLAARGADVVALEVDRHLLPALTEVVESLGPDGGQVEVRNVDVRSVDWSALLGDATWHVVANLPYNLATPLVLDLLADQPQLDRWLVMVQREAGERLVAEPGSRVYGIPSVLRAFWADARIVASVRADLFLPRPKVESVLVAMERRPPPAVDPDVLATVVRAGFGQRRKMLRRSLAPLLTADAISSAGVDPTARAEQLSLDQWVELAHAAGSAVDSVDPVDPGDRADQSGS